MPAVTVRSAHLRYEVLGERGSWVALSPGGRRPLEAVRSLAQRIAAAGHRVLIHDRRNCGASDLVLEGETSESEIWADDLHALLEHFDALPAVIGGGSSGCRMSLLYAIRRPAEVRALLLWRVTGGAFAAHRLAEQYYGQYIRAAMQGGMAAVCETEHFRERIAARPGNRERLMRMDPRRFIASMTHWAGYFARDADLPVIGASEAQLRAITAPACVVPGNDRTHPRAVGEIMQRMLPASELHVLFPEQMEADMVPPEDWAVREADMASIFVDFLRRTAGGA